MKAVNDFAQLGEAKQKSGGGFGIRFLRAVSGRTEFFFWGRGDAKYDSINGEERL